MVVCFVLQVLLHCKSYNIAVVFGCAHLIVVVTSKVRIRYMVLCIFAIEKQTIILLQSWSMHLYRAFYFCSLGTKSISKRKDDYRCMNYDP